MQSSTPAQPSDQYSTLKPHINGLLQKEKQHAKVLQKLACKNPWGPEVV